MLRLIRGFKDLENIGGARLAVVELSFSSRAPEIARRTAEATPRFDAQGCGSDRAHFQKRQPTRASFRLARFIIKGYKILSTTLEGRGAVSVSGEAVY